jgi:4-carboxymuconolactone decarboxylase
MPGYPYEITEEPAELLNDLIVGEVWDRPDLSRRERRLITLGILGLIGDATTLSWHLRGALASGDLDLDDLQEFALHFGCYTGAPRMSAMRAAIKTASEEV